MEYNLLDQAQARQARLRVEADYDALVQEAKKARSKHAHDLIQVMWQKTNKKHYWLGLLMLLTLLLGIGGTMV